MKKKRKSENRKETDKKGAERMRRFKKNQDNPMKKKVDVPEDDGLTCQVYWEKSVVNGDDEWCERFYYYNKNEKKVKPLG
jgi:hypothetical protein